MSEEPDGVDAALEDVGSAEDVVDVGSAEDVEDAETAGEVGSVEEVEDPEARPTYCAYTEYNRGVDVADLPATGEGTDGVEAAVFAELYEVEDPEMPISVVDLGLIYGVDVEDGHATVTMTLTYTGCPARDYLQEDVRLAAERAGGVDSAAVELVWNPEWNLEMVTEAGRQDLREFGVSV